MSQDYVDKIVWFFVKQLAEKCKKKFHTHTKKNNAMTDNTEHNNESVKEILKGNSKNGDGEYQLEEKFDSKSVNLNKEQNPQDIQKVGKDVEVNEMYNQKQKSKVKKRDEETEQLNVTDKTLQDVLKEKRDEIATANNSLFFHSTLFFLWCIITLINLPAALTWAHNFK